MKILKWIRSHKLLTFALVALVVFSITPAIIVTRTYFIVHPDNHPVSVPLGAVVEKQTESFTCGVHSLSTIYKSYGLNPEEERIRWRLGADTKAVFWMWDSTGALHPDIYMVLGQDHFDIQLVAPVDQGAWNKIIEHLETKHMAIFLIKRRENGNLHWVVGSGVEDQQAIIYDSLFSEPYVEGEGFLEGFVVSTLLVRPAEEHKRKWLASIKDHIDGIKALKLATSRIQQLSQHKPQPVDRHQQI